MLEDTLLALEMGAVETLIVWDEVDIDRCAYIHKFLLVCLHLPSHYISNYIYIYITPNMCGAGLHYVSGWFCVITPPKSTKWCS
jgi:hypothetical protein